MSNGETNGGGAMESITQGLDIVKSAVDLSDGNITRKFDKQTKRATKSKDCECPVHDPNRQIFRVLKYRHRLFGIPGVGFWDQVRIRLGIRWQYNGCDVIGAIPYLGSSVARMGWSANIEAVAIDTDTTSDAECECCETASCVTFQYTITIDPPLQATRTHSGEITVCGDGSSDHTIYN
ncbi:MAG: hypothetical protein R3281_02280 [Balneolaceae bacterium]|nr:hypothetical protein [Balneolaceae bacterium]